MATARAADPNIYDDPDNRALGRALMADHGCLLHQGPNPYARPCRACTRRVQLIRDLGWTPPPPPTTLSHQEQPR